MHEENEYKIFDLTTHDIGGLEIKKSYLNHCYIADTSGKYSGFILSNKVDTQTICDVVFFPSSKNGLYIPRLTFSKVRTSTGEIKENKKEKIRIAFNNSEEGVEEFWEMIRFLASFKSLVDLGDFDSKYKIVSTDEVVLHLNDMEGKDKVEEITRYIQRSNIKIEDFVYLTLHSNRKAVLEEFKNLLNLKDSSDVYRKKHEQEIKGTGEEAVWHHFLKNNGWLLGINLDIRFIADFTDEVSVGNPDTANKDNPKVDLMGLSDYTFLIELKTPNTDIFTQTKSSEARAGTWSFIEGFSQCLAQKSHWDKESKGKDLVNGELVISQEITRTDDPKTIFIVGNKKREFPTESMNKNIHLKRDTFQRFRRNNRNVEIVTYDELYERANFIVNGKDTEDMMGSPHDRHSSIVQ